MGAGQSSNFGPLSQSTDENRLDGGSVVVANNSNSGPVLRAVDDDDKPSIVSPPVNTRNDNSRSSRAAPSDDGNRHHRGMFQRFRCVPGRRFRQKDDSILHRNGKRGDDDGTFASSGRGMVTRSNTTSRNDYLRHDSSGSPPLLPSGYKKQHATPRHRFRIFRAKQHRSSSSPNTSPGQLSEDLASSSYRGSSYDFRGHRSSSSSPKSPPRGKGMQAFLFGNDSSVQYDENRLDDTRIQLITKDQADVVDSSFGNGDVVSSFPSGRQIFSVRLPKKSEDGRGDCDSKSDTSHSTTPKTMDDCDTKFSDNFTSLSVPIPRDDPTHEPVNITTATPKDSFHTHKDDPQTTDAFGDLLPTKVGESRIRKGFTILPDVDQQQPPQTDDYRSEPAIMMNKAPPPQRTPSKATSVIYELVNVDQNSTHGCHSHAPSTTLMSQVTTKADAGSMTITVPRGCASQLFTPDAVKRTSIKPVDEMVCIDQTNNIYVCDIGLTRFDCDLIVNTTERCSQGSYAAYTYAKQTLGCREHDALAVVCEVPVMKACESIRTYLDERQRHDLVLDDREPHIVKYDVSKKERQKLDMHTDKSEWTFLIALSEGCGMDYDGGGTYFEAIHSTVHIQRGHALVFPGKLRHRGQKITSGRRFLLVGFLVDKSSSLDERDTNSKSSTTSKK